MNKITYTATKANSNKSIEYWNPYTNTYQDSPILINLPDGSYSGFKVRLKTSNPEIVAYSQSIITLPITSSNTRIFESLFESVFE